MPRKKMPTAPCSLASRISSMDASMERSGSTAVHSSRFRPVRWTSHM